MLNVCTIAGRLAADPDLKHTQSGVSVVNFTLAVDSEYKQGDEKVCYFIPCVAWRGTADFVSKFFSKGRMAIVSGELQTRKYEDKDGNKRTAFEIMAKNVYFGDSKRDGAAQTEQSGTAQNFSELADSAGGELPF